MAAYDSGCPVEYVRHNCSTAAITTAWTTLVSALADHTSVIEIYNSSLGTLQLAHAGVAIPYAIFPSGGNGRVGLLMDAGASLQVRSIVNETISSGVLMLNILR